MVTAVPPMVGPDAGVTELRDGDDVANATRGPSKKIRVLKMAKRAIEVSKQERELMFFSKIWVSKVGVGDPARFLIGRG